MARLLRHFYYSNSAHGAKETWPLIDYYVPTMLLLAITVNFLKYRSILIYLAGWIFCCITIVGPMPIYSTQLVPTPVTTWGTPHPPPFAPLPQNSPFLLVMSFGLVLLKFLAKFEDEEPQQEES